MIKIIDCGSQLTHNIARRIRELGVFAEVVPFRTPADQVLQKDLEGIVISGGQWSVYDDKAPSVPVEVLSSGVPILGICYGQQTIAHQLGGKVTPSKNREYGRTRVSLERDSPLFQRNFSG